MSLTHSKTSLKNTTIEHSERIVTFETFDQSDEEKNLLKSNRGTFETFNFSDEET